MRFFHAWQLLATDNNWTNYNSVLMTDVRDVLFQSNPFTTQVMMDLDLMNTEFIASSEDMTYENEIWGADNMMNGFGPLVYNTAIKWPIFNVGVIAGSSFATMGLFQILYNMTVGRYIPSDQSSYNLLVNMAMPYRFYRQDHHAPWTCQCGTILDPTKNHYRKFITSPIPLIEDGIVYTGNNHEKFSILHQWDRVPELKKIIEAKYV